MKPGCTYLHQNVFFSNLGSWKCILVDQTKIRPGVDAKITRMNKLGFFMNFRQLLAEHQSRFDSQVTPSILQLVRHLEAL